MGKSEWGEDGTGPLPSAAGGQLDKNFVKNLVQMPNFYCKAQ